MKNKKEYLKFKKGSKPLSIYICNLGCNVKVFYKNGKIGFKSKVKPKNEVHKAFIVNEVFYKIGRLGA